MLFYSATPSFPSPVLFHWSGQKFFNFVHLILVCRLQVASQLISSVEIPSAKLALVQAFEVVCSPVLR
jgi:hypothetical protein